MTCLLYWRVVTIDCIREKGPKFQKKPRINEDNEDLPNLPTCSPNLLLNVGDGYVLTDKRLEHSIWF